MLLPPLKPLLDLRCCQCLAGPRSGNLCAFNAIFASPSQDVERILRWQQRLTFHTFHLLRDYVCLRVGFTSQVYLFDYSHYFNWPPNLCTFLFVQLYPSGLFGFFALEILPALAWVLSLRISPKPSTSTTSYLRLPTLA